MASTKSEETINDADKAVQARQDGSEPFDQQKYQILKDKCMYLHLFLVHLKILLKIFQIQLIVTYSFFNVEKK